MGFFDFLKKGSTPTKGHQAQEVVVNSFGERMDMLTKDGELPFGWVTQNKNFTERINTEFSYFLQLWLDARNKSPKELYSALKSFVLYLEDAERLCKSKGECFEFWFYEILTAPNYIEKRKAELRELEINLKKG